MRGLLALCAAACCTLVAASGVAPAGAEEGVVVYRPPVDAPVIDRFRPPLHDYGPGNRGIDYATEPGMPVGAAGAGVVTFAGRVGDSLHVVVLHDDGVRTSYSFLASVVVVRGEAVDAGDLLGTAGEGMHFGARVGSTYVDPAVLLGGGSPRAQLVPNRARRPGTAAEERSWVERTVRAVGHAVVSAGSRAGHWIHDAGAQQLAVLHEEIKIWIHYGQSLNGPLLLPLIAFQHAWNGRDDACTQEGAPIGNTGPGRMLVLVAGLGSTSERAAVWRIDTAALGYRPGDVHRFSYAANGGRYTAADTQLDIRESAARLIAQVDHIRSMRTGTAVDIVAHSQGGLVARTALALGLEGVATLVTLGTPHGGADLATIARAIASTDRGGTIAGALELLAGIRPGATSVAQMAETSDFIHWLANQELPEGVRFVSIAARNDWIVPNVRSRVDGADHVVIEIGEWPGVNEHDALPASAAAGREIRLALNGRDPTCQTFADRFFDEVQGRSLALVEDWIGLGAKVGIERVG